MKTSKQPPSISQQVYMMTHSILTSISIMSATSITLKLTPINFHAENVSDSLSVRISVTNMKLFVITQQDLNILGASAQPRRMYLNNSWT